MATKRILSLGQCGADHAGIAWTIRSHFDAEVVSAGTAEDALTLLRDEDFALVLVNRVFDWNGASGVDFIARLKTEEGLKDIPVMLVSNYDDPQRQAVQLGALPGFGKAALQDPRTLDRLRKALAAVPAKPPESPA
jgi:two-component system chemotaxis response regulator CheY